MQYLQSLFLPLYLNARLKLEDYNYPVTRKEAEGKADTKVYLPKPDLW